VLEFEAAFFSVAFPANDHERGHEARHLKILAQFFGAPDLSVLDFQCFSAAGLGIDFCGEQKGTSLIAAGNGYQ
jgi:hypothetical protein